MKISNLKIENDFILCSSAELNKSTEEISEDLLDHVFVDIADKADSAWVHLNQSAFFFIFLYKHH